MFCGLVRKCSAMIRDYPALIKRKPVLPHVDNLAVKSDISDNYALFATGLCSGCPRLLLRFYLHRLEAVV
jgi:hypothetical protein